MIDEGIKRVRLEPDTDLLHVLEDVNADRAPRLIERDGKALALVVSPDTLGSLKFRANRRIAVGSRHDRESRHYGGAGG